MKTILLSVSIVLYASMFTSCQSDYERAYIAECSYRLAKEGIYSPSDTTKYKNEFESIYRCMEPEAKEAYKQYREDQKRMEKEVSLEHQKTTREVTSMLND